MLPNVLLFIRNRLKKDSITKLDISLNKYNIYFIIECMVMLTISELNQIDDIYQANFMDKKDKI